MALQFGGAPWARNEDERFLRARLDLIAATLPYTVIINLLWTLVGIAPLLGEFPAFGRPPAWAFSVAMGLVLTCSAAAYILWRAYRHGRERSTRQWLQVFVALQAAVGVSWGATIWAFWQPGNDVNNAALAVIYVGVIAMCTVTRTAHLAVCAAGIIPAFLAFWLSTLTAPHEFAIYLAIAVPLWTGFIAFIGYSGKLRVDELLTARFANENMSRALEEAHDEALRKRFEAEAANSSKTSFLVNMSHELRTPLNAILGFSEIIAKESVGFTGSPRYKEYAADIYTSGTHLLSLINDLLDVAKIEAGRMEIEPHHLNAAQALSDAVKLVAAKTHDRRQTLRIAVEPDAPPLFADERAFKQIVINLVSNAEKFTRPDGYIDVVARASPDGEFELLIKDDGPGIPKAKLDRIFEPFAQIDNRYGRQSGGTGLGLALVRKLAELHGGRVRIESEEGHGTTCIVTLPLQQTRHAAAA